jgi:L-aminopeptidase/D-esterase-like protein
MLVYGLKAHIVKGLTDIPGILVGHASDYDGITGCTVILCERGAVAGLDVRGSATGSEEFGLMAPGHVTGGRIHAVVLAGGSAFGLEACSGVRRFLEHKGVGFETGAARVPLVTGAILYDLGIGKASVRPSREMGESAAAAASDKPVAEGCVGAGTGATAGKILGMRNAMKAGIGTWTVELAGGLMVSALVATNPLGDIIDPRTGSVVAGTRKAPDSKEFANSAQVILDTGRPGGFRHNTTLAVVATNAALDQVQTTKVAELASLGMARAISPVNMTSDGDVVFALSVGPARANVDQIGVAAAEAVAQAIIRSAKLARSLGGVPGLAGE